MGVQGSEWSPNRTIGDTAGRWGRKYCYDKPLNGETTPANLLRRIKTYFIFAKGSKSEMPDADSVEWDYDLKLEEFWAELELGELLGVYLWEHQDLKSKLETLPAFPMTRNMAPRCPESGRHCRL